MALHELSCRPVADRRIKSHSTLPPSHELFACPSTALNSASKGSYKKPVLAQGKSNAYTSGSRQKTAEISQVWHITKPLVSFIVKGLNNKDIK